MLLKERHAAPQNTREVYTVRASFSNKHTQAGIQTHAHTHTHTCTICHPLFGDKTHRGTKGAMARKRGAAKRIQRCGGG